MIHSRNPPTTTPNILCFDVVVAMALVMVVAMALAMDAVIAAV